MPGTSKRPLLVLYELVKKPNQHFFERQSKKLRRQGARIPRTEVYFRYAAGTREEGQRSIWTFYKAVILCALLLPCLFLAGCCRTPYTPDNMDNLCEIFRGERDWYRGAAAARDRWGIPIPVLMAFMHQESRFESRAKPPRTTCLCIFPGPRPSSAYGYAQALDETWDAYIRATGNSGADRNDFDDAVDFIGWYCAQGRSRCGIEGGDAYSLYLGYHEGWGGFSRKTHASKPWLLAVARKVQSRAKMYQSQLAACESEFIRKRGCCLWPF